MRTPVLMKQVSSLPRRYSDSVMILTCPFLISDYFLIQLLHYFHIQKKIRIHPCLNYFLITLTISAAITELIYITMSIKTDNQNSFLELLLYLNIIWSFSLPYVIFFYFFIYAKWPSLVQSFGMLALWQPHQYCSHLC